MEKKKVVGVIGAGPSGLVTIKELLEEGHEVICFEKAADLGGVYQNTYPSMQLTSSTWITSFSDFLPPLKSTLHSHHKEYVQYLISYAKHFQFIPHIHFCHHVRSLKRNSSGSWTLVVWDEVNKKEGEHIFDAVAVCSGVHQILNMPEFKGQNSFEGEMIHSQDYKGPINFQDKRVVVVGAGESASDIVDEISKVTKECYISIRRGALVLPRKIFGRPNDYYTNRLFYTLPDWLFRERHKKIHYPSLALFGLSVILIFCIGYFVEAGFRWLISLSPYVELLSYSALFIILLYIPFVLLKFFFVDCSPFLFNKIFDLMFKSKAGHGEQFATKSEGMARALAQKRCVLSPDIKALDKHDVVFQDDRRETIDAIIFCTGYKIEFPFLEHGPEDMRHLYKNCFDERYREALCFIGFARPAIGSMPPISELQARWFAQLVSGKKILPSKEEMNKEIVKDALEHREKFKVVSDRIPGLVNYTTYMDQLAGFIGCKPCFAKLWNRPDIFIRIFINPFSGHQYRLNDSDKKRRVAISAIKRVRINLFQWIYGFGMAVIILLAEMLYQLGFSYFQPNLRIWRKDDSTEES